MSDCYGVTKIEFYFADKSTSVSIQLKWPQFRHSREGGNPEVIVITNSGFLLSQE